MNPPYEVDIYTFNRWISEARFLTKDVAINYIKNYLLPARLIFQEEVIYKNIQAVKWEKDLEHKFIIEEFSDNQWRYVEAFSQEKEVVKAIETCKLPSRIVYGGKILYHSIFAKLDKMTSNSDEYLLETSIDGNWRYLSSFLTRQAAFEAMKKPTDAARVVFKGEIIYTNKAWEVETEPKSYNYYLNTSQPKPKYKIEVCYKGGQWITDKEFYSATEVATELEEYRVPARIIYRGNVIKTNDIGKMVEAKRKEVDEKTKEMKPKYGMRVNNTADANGENGLKSPQTKVEEMEKVEKFWIVMALDHKGPVELGQKTYKRYSSKSQAISDAEKLTTPSQRYGVLELVSISSVQYVANVKTDEIE